ncbi:MAG TPA: hypothetical protein VNK04_00175 [Gemmataceae bacterium]|nr:hypothetical protein [Gemmataceae bacterium]
MTGPAQQALAMLDAFASVGAERFDLTITDAASGKVRFLPARSRDPLRHTMPAILQEAAAQRHNVIVRPRSTDAMELSSKAQENGETYALRTARNAAAALERRRGLQR